MRRFAAAVGLLVSLAACGGREPPAPAAAPAAPVAWWAGRWVPDVDALAVDPELATMSPEGQALALDLVRTLGAAYALEIDDGTVVRVIEGERLTRGYRVAAEAVGEAVELILEDGERLRLSRQAEDAVRWVGPELPLRRG